jgi:hypothetical protein
MNTYQVAVTYKRGDQRIESVFNITSTSIYSAKIEAEKSLNRKGIYEIFTHKVYGGNQLISDNNLPF